MSTVALLSRHFEAGDSASAEARPLLVLHGLFGSSRSWVAVARKLAEKRPVTVLDLRNHGRSPHQAPHDYPSMAADVERFVDEGGLGDGVSSFDLMGHSMGGKVAMRLACDRPEQVAHLIVLDIAPVSYPLDGTVLEALRAVDLDGVQTRSDAEKQLLDSLPDRGTRLFLLTNLERVPGGDGYRWSIPLDVLHQDREEVFVNPLGANDQYPGPTLFLGGGNSAYITKEGFEAASAFFPTAQRVMLEGVGHNVHTEGGEGFLDVVTETLDSPGN